MIASMASGLPNNATEANAKRIVACVNACAGLNENQLNYLAKTIREGNAAREALKERKDKCIELADKLEAERAKNTNQRARIEALQEATQATLALLKEILYADKENNLSTEHDEQIRVLLTKYSI